MENPGKQNIICACESQEYLFIATQGKNLYVLDKQKFCLVKKFATLQHIFCLSKMESASGTVILIGMQQKYLGSIKVLTTNSFDFEEIDLQSEVGHQLTIRQIVFD